MAAPRPIVPWRASSLPPPGAQNEVIGATGRNKAQHRATRRNMAQHGATWRNTAQHGATSTGQILQIKANAFRAGRRGASVMAGMV